MTEQTKAAKPTTTIESVTMDDGRVVEFAGKRKLLKESFVENGAVKVRMDFRNGETRLFTIPASLSDKFAAHGAEQKLGDEIAGLEDLDDAVLAIDDLMDRLNKGEWNQKREGGSMSGTSILARALAEHTGKSMEEIKVFLGKKTQAEKVALRGNPKVKPIVERLEAEKAAKGISKIDTDSLLGELDGLGGGEAVTDTQTDTQTEIAAADTGEQFAEAGTGSKPKRSKG